jgi:hypothetical protein
MNVSQTTLFFSEFGRVGRVFLQPDARTAAAKEGFRWGPASFHSVGNSWTSELEFLKSLWGLGTEEE